MKRLLAVVSSALLLLLLLLSAGRAGSSPGYPVPEQDPFYAVPGDVASYADGAVLDSRAI
ncbi:MAG: hypothetical protein QOI15_1744, partial [Pseudonocardiales bacterium]|nr:hypothetical protein [Pseudonocardiales bacterium]